MVAFSCTSTDCFSLGVFTVTVIFFAFSSLSDILLNLYIQIPDGAKITCQKLLIKRAVGENVFTNFGRTMNKKIIVIYNDNDNDIYKDTRSWNKIFVRRKRKHTRLKKNMESKKIEQRFPSFVCHEKRRFPWYY